MTVRFSLRCRDLWGGGGSLKLHHHIQRIREYMRFCIFSALHCTSISMSICVLLLYSRFFWYIEYDGAIFIKVPWSLRGWGSLKLHHHIQRIREYMRFCIFSAPHCTSISMSICVLHLYSRFFWYIEYDGAIFIKVPWSLRGWGSLKLHHHIQRIREYMRFCIFSALHCTSISMSICVLHLYSRFFWYTEYGGAIFIKVPWSLRGWGFTKIAPSYSAYQRIYEILYFFSSTLHLNFNVYMCFAPL